MSFEVSQQNELQNFTTKLEKVSHKSIFLGFLVKNSHIITFSLPLHIKNKKR